MLDHTTNPNVRKTLFDLLLRLLAAIGCKIFRTDDHRAREEGWQIITHQEGLSRSYRDPRFDSLISCPACHGLGHSLDGITCSTCQGERRIVLGRTDTTHLNLEPPERGPWP